MTTILKAKLPLSPTVNNYWKPTVRKVGSKHIAYMYLSCKKYKDDVVAIIGKHYPSRARLKVVVTIHFSDRRKTDLDNRLKALFDALAYVGVYEDDTQIDELIVKRGDIIKGGLIDIEIVEL